MTTAPPSHRCTCRLSEGAIGWDLLRDIGANGKPVAADAFVNNGGSTFVFVYMMVVAVQAMNQTFSFVVGLGATRRDYFAGTSLTFVALSVIFGVGIALLVLVERATAHGVDARLELYPADTHVFHVFWSSYCH